MTGSAIILYLSPFLGLGYAGEFKLYNNKVCISYTNQTFNGKYHFQKKKVESDFYDISKAFIDYFKIYERKDCVINCNINLSLVTSNYLTYNFKNWSSGTIQNGNYSVYNSSANKPLTGLYVYDYPTHSHSIYITDTNNERYNYAIFSHEVAHYWFKRKCFNEGYYNEFYAINFHEYFMNNYSYLIKNSLLYGDKK